MRPFVRSMHASLSLQLSLFRKQLAEIEASVEGRSAAFNAYEARYRRLTRRMRGATSASEVLQRMRAADVVYVGDYHTLKAAQAEYLRLVEEACVEKRRVVLALEFFEAKHQARIDAFLAGALSLRELARHAGHGPPEEGLFAHIAPVLEYARNEGLRVLAIDKRASGPRSLKIRDDFAGERIARVLKETERPKVMVLIGQYHIAPPHLPASVESALGRERVNALIVYQNCEALYWSLARSGRVHRTSAVKLSDDAVCLFNTSPVLCQQSYLDYLEMQHGDEPVEANSLGERFREVARLMAKTLRVDVTDALADLEVLTPGEVDVLGRIQRRGGYTRTELEHLRAHLLSRESCYLPRARVAYLASLSLSHVAEEAAHFVRHCCVGRVMEAPRSARQTFYARCLEEALGFFGSRLVHPHRPCTGMAEWTQAFAERRGWEKQVAAFVLAHKAAEAEGEDAAAPLAPVRPFKIMNAVSHALGYLLGDALHAAYDAGRVTRSELRALFHAPLSNPQETYFAWVRLCHASGGTAVSRAA